MNRLRQIRKSAGVTLSELSSITAIHQHTIERHEKGDEIDKIRLSVYADTFQLPIEFIMGIPNNIMGRFDCELAMLELPDMFHKRFIAYNREVLEPGKQYYLIWEIHALGNIEQGAYSRWVSNTPDGCYENRVPRLLSKPDKNQLEKVYGKLMIINTKEEALAMQLFGGAALIEKQMCEEYFPEFFSPGLLPERNT